MLPTIAIIMSVYNGAEYLPQQLSSIANQSYKNWQLFIRDDNSSDNTLSLIREYALQYPGKVVLVADEKKNIGVSESFFRLLNRVESDYIMFCDQDDVWLPDKIKLTLDKVIETERMFGSDSPILVHTDLKVASATAEIISDSFWRYQHLDPDNSRALSKLLVQNVVTGCTMMINRPLRKKLLRMPKQAIVYDWWIALIAAAFGRVDYVSTPTILYRQHERNSIGAKKWSIDRALKMFRSQREMKAAVQKTQAQAKAFLDMFRHELTGEYVNILSVYSTLNCQGYFLKRLNLIKYGFFKIGLLRNIGLFLTI